MSEPIELEPLSGRRALRRFVEFPFDLYRGDAMWVPPIIKSELDAIDPALKTNLVSWWNLADGTDNHASNNLVNNNGVSTGSWPWAA